MSPVTRVHLSIVIDESVVPTIAAARHRWDPDMARRVPPHVTLVYPEEFDAEDVLVDRAREAAEQFGPFTIRTEGVARGDRFDARWVFVPIADPTESWQRIRQLILRPPLSALEVSPHLTLVHPRTSDQGATAWPHLRQAHVAHVLTVNEFCLTSTDPHQGIKVCERFQLAGTTRQIVTAVILVDGNQGLFGLRHPDRERYPGLWELIGGRLENGEHPTATGCREIREEVGVEVDPSDLRHVETIVLDSAELVVFAASTWRGVPSNAAPEEHAEIRWCDAASLAMLETTDSRLVALLAAACSLVS